MEFNWIGEALDLLASISGKIGRWFNNKGKKVCFLIWIGCCLYWLFRDFYLNLWTQGIFCFFSIIFHVHGYKEWKKKKFGEKNE